MCEPVDHLSILDVRGLLATPAGEALPAIARDHLVAGDAARDAGAGLTLAPEDALTFGTARPDEGLKAGHSFSIENSRGDPPSRTKTVPSS